MTPNHIPNWQEWTPIEGIEYWNGFLNLALEWYSESLTDEMTLEEFLLSQQYLDCMERILTHQDAKELWKQLDALRIPPFLFLCEYHNAVDGRKRFERAKKNNDDAIKIEKQITKLIGMLENSYCGSVDFISNLEEMLKRARYYQSVYEKEKQIVSDKTRKDVIDETYLRESLSNFFKKWTQEPRHNLVKIALNVTFYKKISTDKIRKATSRSNKNK